MFTIDEVVLLNVSEIWLLGPLPLAFVILGTVALIHEKTVPEVALNAV